MNAGHRRKPAPECAHEELKLPKVLPNTNPKKVFQFLIRNNFANISNNLELLNPYGLLSIDYQKNNLFNIKTVNACGGKKMMSSVFFFLEPSYLYILTRTLN